MSCRKFRSKISLLSSSKTVISLYLTVPSTITNLTNISLGQSYFYIQWSHVKGHVESYKVSPNCSIETGCEKCTQIKSTEELATKIPTICDPRVHHSMADTFANITGLLPGTHCSVTIEAISGNLESRPFQYPNIKTNEAGNQNVPSYRKFSMSLIVGSNQVWNLHVYYFF